MKILAKPLPYEIRITLEYDLDYSKVAASKKPPQDFTKSNFSLDNMNTQIYNKSMNGFIDSVNSAKYIKVSSPLVFDISKTQLNNIHKQIYEQII